MRFFLVLAGLSCCAACESDASERPPPRMPYPSQPAPGPAPAGGPPVALADRRPEDISRVINANMARFSDCYQRSESFMTGKSGNVTVFFDIAPSGQVTRATEIPPPGVALPGPLLVDANLARCLVQGMSTLAFDPARDATAASWTFPFSR